MELSEETVNTRNEEADYANTAVADCNPPGHKVARACQNLM